MDTRLKLLSYSSRITLHNCPRKYQLYRLNAARIANDEKTSVTFALGHLVGAGIQGILAGHSIEKIYLDCFMMWDTDLFAEDKKVHKSFWESMIAIERFYYIRDSSLLTDYELVYYTTADGTKVPAVELSFIIHLPNGFKYRGYVDAVLKHKITGAVLVLEVKTTGLKSVNAAMYKNSAQAIGYSIVLDVLFPELSSYEVLYLIYMTSSREYYPLPFNKSYLQRALWIQELLLDCELITAYESSGVYPMHGESCFNYFKECEYLNTCTLSTSLITQTLSEEDEVKIEETNKNFHISLSVEDLIQAQIRKSTTS